MMNLASPLLFLPTVLTNCGSKDLREKKIPFLPRTSFREEIQLECLLAGAPTKNYCMKAIVRFIYLRSQRLVKIGMVK
uniref:Putative secreted protein n=1 Tax=Anopheles marajoara TaxID=58244 RepID=A0A2M4CCA3_9DIPT